MAAVPEEVSGIVVSTIYERFIDSYRTGMNSGAYLKAIAKLEATGLDDFGGVEALLEAIGARIPVFTLPAIRDPNAAGISSDDLRAGRVSVVNFFASWFLPCRLEAPLLQELSRETNVQILGINYKDQRAEMIASAQTRTGM